MKNYCLIISLFVLSSVARAQVVNIPDAAFLNVLANTNCVDIDEDGTGDISVDSNNDGLIQLSEAEAVLRLVVTGPSITSLEGIQSFTNLQYLRCYVIGITSLDLATQNLNLTTLIFEHLGLNSLDVTQMSNLKYLNFHDNNISALDVSQNTSLETLICSFNQLTEIDLSQNIELKKLTIYNNLLSSIDVTSNPNLESLNISKNPIDVLNVSQNLNLIVLRCGNHSSLFSSLEVSNNTILETLSVGDTQLTNLDISNNPNLKALGCDDNQLTSLDISNNPNLFSVSCENNALVSLNLKNGANSTLVNMKARNNPNLGCIQVDDEDIANTKVCITSDPLPSWCKDATTAYSENCILGVEDQGTVTFSIYPNPAKDILYIQAVEVLDKVQIYSITGVLIKTSKDSSIDISNLATGLYFVKVALQGNSVTKRFLKS